jgi:Flp pilus assembly protein TadD
MARGQYEPAIASYRKLISREESTTNALALVNAYLAGGDVAKALSFLETWVKSHPEDIAALRALAETQFRAGKLVQAKQNYQKVIAARPDDASTINNYANLLNQMNDPGAQEAAERALKQMPNNPAYADTLGWILVGKGQVEAGLRYLREARLRSPENSEIRFHLASALAKIGRNDEAREELKAALAGSSRVSGGTVTQLKKELGL